MDTSKLPTWFTEEEGRKSYFENQDGEAWCAVVREDALLFSGEDLGWQVHRIDNPDFTALAEGIRGAHPVLGPHFDGVLMGTEEIFWILSMISGREAPRMPARTAEGGFLPMAEAQKWASSLGLKSRREWDEYTERSDFPSDVNKTPSQYEDFMKAGGFGWWLGTGTKKGT